MEMLANLCTTIVGKILLSLIVWVVGKFIVKKIVGLMTKIPGLNKIEPNTGAAPITFPKRMGTVHLRRFP